MAGTKLLFCTVVEAPTFSHAAKEVFEDADLFDLVDHLATDPEAGVLVPGGSGLRKLRWRRQSVGKRGGARVIYFYRHKDRIVLLLGAYAKSAKGDLTEAEKVRFRRMVEEFCAHD